jgi:hypothetical protein
MSRPACNVSTEPEHGGREEKNVIDQVRTSSENPFLMGLFDPVAEEIIAFDWPLARRAKRA